MEITNLRKRKSPWFYLLLIPAVLILDIPLMLLFMYLDTWLLTPAPGKTGYPMPIISMIGLVGLAILTGIVVIGSLGLAIYQYYKNKKRYND